jgi:NAD/FAD-utilizing enzyme apparently involved in cell division
MKNVCEMLYKLNTSPQQYAKFGIRINQDGKKRTAFEVLGYKEVTWDQIKRIFPNLRRQKISNRIEKQIKINSFYKRYSERQQCEIEELKKERFQEIHKNTNFNRCEGLSNEIKEILSKNKPNNIEEAKQLPGMTPAAASILLRYVKK